MLGKLMKYEWKATGRVLLPIYGIFILTGLLTNIFLSTNLTRIGVIAVSLFVAMAFVSIIMTIVLLVQRFGQNLLQDEGYLMFTLPVTATQLILSKLIVAVCWGIIGSIAGLLAGLLIAWDANVLHGLGEFFTQIFPQYQSVFWMFVLAIVVSFAAFMLSIYTSKSVGQLPVFSKHRRLVSLACFIAIYIVFGNVSSLLEQNTLLEFDTMQKATDILWPLGYSTLITAVFGIILFFVTRYILKNHLNLE